MDAAAKAALKATLQEQEAIESAKRAARRHAFLDPGSADSSWGAAGRAMRLQVTPHFS